MIGNLFRKKRDENEGDRPTLLTGPRIPRHSSGWEALLKHLREESGLRVLDIGPTSPQNINFLTGMGHSVYMADVVHEALRGGWELPPPEGEDKPGFNIPGFFEQNLNFQGREFDVVLLWATLDYIPEALTPALMQRLRAATHPGGRVLAIFHSKATGPYTAYCRYHLTDTSEIQMQEAEPFPVLRVYTNRQIERLFEGFSANRFFLAKDNLYEVIITR
ncbi:MAG TPA: methyltransferase domain-containing protein [Acidobacteriaceae bacterium]|nr:methyltransferase domain-containing protein [Acidobacteriaceae bacterium]